MQYIPSNAIFESLRRLFRRRIGDADPAYLGDGDGAGARVDVPGRPGYVYVRLQRTSPPFMARSGQAAYPNYPGAPVYVAYRYNGEPEIVGTNYKALDNVGIDTRVLNPLNQQSKWVYPYQLTYGLASAVATAATDSFLVTVKKFRHYVGNLLQAFDTPLEADKIDLEPYVPAADMHCYAAVWIDAFLNEAVVTTSVAQAITSPLDETDLQELVVRTAASRPPDGIPLKAFYLANAQGTLRQSELEVDLRLWLYNPPAWGFPNVLSTLERIHPNYTLVTGPFTTTGVGDLDTSETGAQHIIVHKSNMDATDAPDANDDSGDGYSIGSQWFDTSTGILYVASDVTVGAAVWEEVAGGGGGAPFVDSTALIKGSADATKLARFEVDGFTTGTTRVFTLPDYDGTLATLAGAETLANKVLSQLHLLIGGFKGIFTHSNTADRTYTLPNYNATLSPGTTKGDVIAHDGTDNVRVPVGADYQYIVADSTTASGLNYARGSLDVPGDTAESWAAKDLLYLVDGTSNTWAKIDTDAVPPKISDTRGVALTDATHPSSDNPIRREGIVSGYSGLTPGAKIYADTTAGGYTQTKPTVSVGSGQICLVEIGYAITDSTAFIDKDKPIEYFKREWLDNGETVSITHHADPEGQSRVPDAYLTSNTEVIKDQYTDSDTDAPLKRRSTGSTVVVDAAGASTTSLGDNGAADFRLAQQFEVTTTGYASQFVVRAGANAGVPTVLPSYRIEHNNALLTTPNGVVVANSSGTLSAWTASADNTIAYSTTMPYLVAGQKYWLILELSAMQAAGVAYTVLRNTAGGYANGVMKWDSTTTGTWPDTWVGGGGANDMRMSITTVIVNDKLAQSITFGATEDITRIELYLKRTGAFTTEVLNVELYQADGSGQPVGGPLYTSEDVLVSSVGLSAGYVSFEFATPASTFWGNDWAIVLKTTANASATAYIDWLVDTSSPGFAGVFQTQRNTTWADFSPAADARFIVYGVGTYYEERIVVGLGSAVMEAHSGDASYADQDTVTTFENVYGVLVDATVKVRLG